MLERNVPQNFNVEIVILLYKNGDNKDLSKENTHVTIEHIQIILNSPYKQKS